MDELIYSDPEGEYYLLDFNPSHSEMVIRKRVYRSHNIDLFFKPVNFLNLRTRLSGIEIYKSKRKEDQINPYNRAGIFKVMDINGFLGYIDASLLVVFHNQLDILETSLGNFVNSPDNKEILSVIIEEV